MPVVERRSGLHARADDRDAKSATPTPSTTTIVITAQCGSFARS